MAVVLVSFVLLPGTATRRMKDLFLSLISEISVHSGRRRRAQLLNWGNLGEGQEGAAREEVSGSATPPRACPHDPQTRQEACFADLLSTLSSYSSSLSKVTIAGIPQHCARGSLRSRRVIPEKHQPRRAAKGKDASQPPKLSSWQRASNTHTGHIHHLGRGD